MANIYLMELDRRFQDKDVVYARYSDDIIVFAEDFDALQTCMNEIKEFIKSVGLEINPSKERIFRPDEPYEFLGFRSLVHEFYSGKQAASTASVLRSS